jgi:hypothetical protein
MTEMVTCRRGPERQAGAARPDRMDAPTLPSAQPLKHQPSRPGRRLGRRRYPFPFLLSGGHRTQNAADYLGGGVRTAADSVLAGHVSVSQVSAGVVPYHKPPLRDHAQKLMACPFTASAASPTISARVGCACTLMPSSAVVPSTSLA